MGPGVESPMVHSQKARQYAVKCDCRAFLFAAFCPKTRFLTVIGHKSVTVVTAVALQKSSGLCEETIHRAAVGEPLTETTVTRIADAFGRCV